MDNIVIALDFDDCILPSNSTYFGRVDDDLKLFELNLKRLKMMIDKYNIQGVFITSSWSSILELKNGLISLKEYFSDEKNGKDVVNLYNKYIGNKTIGLSCGDRFQDIETLLSDNKFVIAFDDWDLSKIQSDKFLFVKTLGFIANNLTFAVEVFIDKIKHITFKG